MRNLVIVANRLPVCCAFGDDPLQWRASPGGLVAALEPAVRSSRTRWVGWTGSSDRSTPAFVHDEMQLFPINLTADEVDSYYRGFANSTLWPLYHDALIGPRFDRSWWAGYLAVNQRFADAAVRVAPKDATVWIHDYHLELVPRMIRRQRRDLRIGFFLHIPFPTESLALRVPWRDELTQGMLGADVVGFQTTTDAHNFRRVASRLFGDRVEGTLVEHDGRQVLVDSFPIGIDADAIHAMAVDRTTVNRMQQIRAQLGYPKSVLLGVDRLDYTKGIETRLRAYRALLDEGRLDPEECVMVQVAEPTRDGVPGYAAIRAEVEQLVGAINGSHGGMGRPAVVYVHQHQPLAELVALYRTADVMLVTPLRDGMNLVAKEYVAARGGHDGVLVLSEFAGAAQQMTQALLVNPYDHEGMKDAIEHAVLHRRNATHLDMAALARNVHRHDASHWASSFLGALENRTIVDLRDGVGVP